MNEIRLIRLRAEAFKSFRKETLIELSHNSGFKFLGGENRARPRMGANGAGKSSVWDAVLWCWYGTGARGQKASELTSWGMKKPKVSTNVWIGGSLVDITRSGNPNKLTINGQPAEQSEVDHLLGLSKLRFQHSVLFGQQVRLFPDLGMSERAELLDEVCDLRIWQDAAAATVEELRNYESELGAAMREEANANGRLEEIAYQNLERIEEMAEQWEETQADKRRSMRKELKLAKEELAAAQAKFDALVNARKEIADTKTIEARIATGRAAIIDKRANVRSAKDAIARHEKELAFYEKHRNCPSCHQSISVSHIRDRRAEIATELEELEGQVETNEELAVKYQKALDALARERDAILAEQHTLVADYNNQAAICKQKQISVKRLEEVLADLSDEAENPYKRQLLTFASQERSANKALSSALRTQMRLKGKIAELEYWKTGFKKVRLFLVDQVLGYLTIETEAAAQALGLKDWTIAFSTETENKSGTLKQGVQIIVTSPEATGSWESWSGGEGQRIRLAVALGLASLIQQMAGVNYKWEVFDEPSAWLSTEGIEDLLECLKNRAATTDKSLWLVDHRSLNATSFDELWQVTKKRSGSIVERIR